MNRELESIINGIEYIGDKDLYNGVHIEIATKLRELLTPPTADEVCKALSEYLDRNIYIYWSGNKQFEFVYRCLVNKVNLNILPPHLITLIGRFYEGVIE